MLLYLRTAIAHGHGKTMKAMLNHNTEFEEEPQHNFHAVAEATETAGNPAAEMRFEELTDKQYSHDAESSQHAETSNVRLSN